MEKALKMESLLHQLDTLPVEAKRQVFDFVAFLQIRYERPAPVKKGKKVKLRKEPFVGMWKDREDLSDSVAWVRELRRREWNE